MLFALSQASIHVLEPKALKYLYLGEKMKYSVMNFGKIPYGYSVSGIVRRTDPADGCAPLKSLTLDKTFGAPIALIDRGNCNFAEKVLNAQKAGAKLVLIADNNAENVHKIFPVERTKSTLDQVHIPSLLLSKVDGDQVKTAIELHEANANQEAYKRPVELSVHFELTRSDRAVDLRFILQVDDPQSYELITDFAEYHRSFSPIIRLKIHHKLFMNADLSFKNDECVMSGLDTYCIVRSFGDTREIPGLITETIRQMCLSSHDFTKFAGYASKVRTACFDSENRILSNFQDCANEIYLAAVPAEDRAELRQCMQFGSSENEILLTNNHEETKYFLINYSPLIFINGFYYKGNFDDTEHLMETICNSFETTPSVCNTLSAFVVADDLNYAKLIGFMALVFVVCGVLMAVSLGTFYVLYKRKLRRRLVSELNDKITKALMNYKESSDRSSCKALEGSPSKSRQSIH